MLFPREKKALPSSVYSHFNYLPFSSSQDSLGATVAEQKAAYDKLVANHPKTILSLEHEVYSTLFASSIVPSVH